MFFKFKLKTALLSALFCLFISSKPAFGYINEDNKTVIKFGVFAYLGEKRTTEKYQPIVECLNKRLKNEKIILEVLPEADIDRRIMEGSIDVVTTNPTHYLNARKKKPSIGVLATLVGRDNSEPIYKLGGVILVNSKRQDIYKLSHLAKKTVAIIGTENLGAYRAQAYELKKEGLSINSISTVKYKTQEETIKAVVGGETDAAFVRDGVLERMISNGEINASSVKVLNKRDHPGFTHFVSTALYPEWPVFALPHVSQCAVRHIATALYEIEPQSETAKKAGIYGYTIPADYIEVEELARALRIPPFEKAPEFTAYDVWDKYKFFLALGAFFTLVIALLSAALASLLSKSVRDAKFKELLLSSLGSGVYGADLDGNCVFINSAALKMIGFSKDEVIGKNQHELFHHHRPSGEVYCEKECPIYLTLQDGKERKVEETFVDKNGVFFEVHLTVAPLHGVGAVVAFEDISDRKRLERELRELNENLQTAVAEETEKRLAKERLLVQQSKMAMMGDMMAAIAHQWRQPLNTLSILSQDVYDTYKSNELDESYMKSFEELSVGIIEQMSKTIDDFRSFFKPSKIKDNFTVKSAWEQAISITAPSLKMRYIEASYSQSEDIALFGYKNELAQVFAILIQNAKDALVERGVKSPSITARAKIDGNCAIISVDDNAGGIGEDIIDKIFDYYFTTKSDEKGTGIGLYMAREIITAHMNGSITVKNSALGARFEISIPLLAIDN